MILHIAEGVRYLASGPSETGVEDERAWMLYSVSGSKVLHPLGAHMETTKFPKTASTQQSSESPEIEMVDLDYVEQQGLTLV